MKHAAIVTLTIGEPHRSRWETYARDAWKDYANKCGMDLITVNEPLDRSPRGLSRSLAWQKCLVLSQEWASQYERIVLLDCDIAINPADAPNILEQVDREHVGGVISCAQIHEDLRPLLRAKKWPYERAGRQWQEDQDAHYRMYGLSPMPQGVVQTGVLVANPLLHREIFQAVYNAESPLESTTYEQIPLSYTLLAYGLFRPIDTRFNSLLYETAAVYYPFVFDRHATMHEALVRAMIQVQLSNNFFLHFAHVSEWMQYLRNI